MKVKPNPDRKIEVMRDPVTREPLGKPKSVPLIVRDPVTRLPLPASGKEVPHGDVYWNRRLRAGDVVEVADKAASKSAARES